MADATCSVEGCQKVPAGKGWCGMHYMRWRRHGDISVNKRPVISHAIPVVERFWSMVDQGPGCWLWTGGCTQYGYGRIYPERAAVQVHRFVYELLVGPIPAGYEVDHTCHNFDATCKGGNTCLHRRCVNPAHLEAVTKRENMHRQPRIRRLMEQTHCVHGHAYLPHNLYVSPKDGGRQCRICRGHAGERRRAKIAGAKVLALAA